MGKSLAQPEFQEIETNDSEGRYKISIRKIVRTIVGRSPMLYFMLEDLSDMTTPDEFELRGSQKAIAEKLQIDQSLFGKRLKVARGLNLIHRELGTALYINPLFAYKSNSNSYYESVVRYYLKSRPTWRPLLNLKEPETVKSETLEIVKLQQKETPHSPELIREAYDEAEKAYFKQLKIMYSKIKKEQLEEWERLTDKHGNPYLTKLKGYSNYKVLVLPSVQ